MSTLFRQRSPALVPVAVPAALLLCVGAYALRFELSLGRGFGADLVGALAMLGGGVLLAGVAAWLVLRADSLEHANGALVLRRKAGRQAILVAQLSALNIVPARVFVVGAQHRVERTDLLQAMTPNGPVELARGTFDQMRRLAEAVAALPGARVTAPKGVTELAQFNLSPHLNAQLEGLARAFPQSDVGREATAALGINRTSPSPHDAEVARRLSAADAAARHARRHGKKLMN